MVINALRITKYPDRGKPTSKDLHEPAWSDIESAIRRLDRDRFPFVWLFAGEVDDYPDFSILGGTGAYAMTAVVGDCTYKFHDPRQSDEVIVIWFSDQGASVPMTEVCTDIDRVLLAVRRYHETGTLDSDSWILLD